MTTPISKIIEQARAAQAQYESYSQEQVDQVVTAAAWGIVNPVNNKLLAEMAVADTGLGKIEDKITKNRRKTMGLLRDLKGAKSVGVIAEYPEKGIVEIARPVGVVGAIVPSTNPAATPANKTLNALKGRNAIILAPSPKGDNTCEKLVQIMRAELQRVGAPLDLIQKLPSPINKADTEELMKSVDLIVATGSQNNVRNAYSSGTPAVGVGAGNVVSIVDETADLAEAARKIVLSKSFDNATSCSSENNLVIVSECYENMMAELAKQGAVRLSPENKATLQSAMWPEGKLNQSIIAREASEIIDLAGLTVGSNDKENAKIILVEETQYGSDTPFSGEKLSPVLTVYKANNFEHAQELANGIMNYQGKGHSISIHTSVADRPLNMGLEMPVCRVIVNQIHCYATGGNFDNGLPFSLSMGCGSWGENSISDNMNYKHYLNTTRVVRTIPVNEPTEEEIFGEYWQKFDCHA
jgi:sulfoacetaldehyde dehydrogenase